MLALSQNLERDFYRCDSAIPIDHRAIGCEYILGLLQGAVLKGHCPYALLRKAGLPESVYDDPEAVLTGVEFQRLLYAIQGELNDIFMGFMEQPGKLAMHKEQTRVRYYCGSVGEALTTTTRFREAIRSDISYDYIVDDDKHEFTLVNHYKTVEGVDAMLLHWSRLMTFCKYYSWLAGKHIPLVRACFSGPKPSEGVLENCYSIFNCDIWFNQPETSHTFDKKYLSYPIIRSEGEDMDFVINYPDWFTIPGHDTSWTRHTEQVLKRLQQDGIWSPSIAMVAGMLSLNARALRRHLAQENETFVRIKSRMRCGRAIKLLVSTELPIAEVSLKVGFAEPGDFTRAFVGWTGMSPKAYRCEYRNDPDLLMKLRISGQ